MTGSNDIPGRRLAVMIVIAVICGAAIGYGLYMVLGTPVTHFSYPFDPTNPYLNPLEKPKVTIGPVTGREAVLILIVVLSAGALIALVLRYVPGWVQKELMEDGKE